MKTITEIVEREMNRIVRDANVSSAAPSRGEEPFDFIGEALKKRDALKDELAEAQRRWDIGENRKAPRKSKKAGE